MIAPQPAEPESPETQQSPAVQPVLEGAAFSGTAKMLATNLVGFLLYAAYKIVDKYTLAALPREGCAFVVIVLAGLLYTYYWILVSRTRVDGETIQQSWYRNKCVRIADITKIKFICIPHLEWLIAPRIVVQVKVRGSYTFYAAEPAVVREFAKLSMGL